MRLSLRFKRTCAIKRAMWAYEWAIWAYEQATWANKCAIAVAMFLHRMSDLLEEQESTTASGLVYATCDRELQLELVEDDTAKSHRSQTSTAPQCRSCPSSTIKPHDSTRGIGQYRCAFTDTEVSWAALSRHVAVSRHVAPVYLLTRESVNV